MFPSLGCVSRGQKGSVPGSRRFRWAQLWHTASDSSPWGLLRGAGVRAREPVGETLQRGQPWESGLTAGGRGCELRGGEASGLGVTSAGVAGPVCVHSVEGQASHLGLHPEDRTPAGTSAETAPRPPPGGSPVDLGGQPVWPPEGGSPLGPCPSATALISALMCLPSGLR